MTIFPQNQPIADNNNASQIQQIADNVCKQTNNSHTNVISPIHITNDDTQIAK